MRQSKIVRNALHLFLLMFLVGSVNAQYTDSGITKEEIISKAWKAMFGELNNEDIKSIYIETYFHGSTTPSRLIIKRPNKFRNELAGGDILVFDGERAAWAKRSPDSNGTPRGSELINPDELIHYPIDIGLSFPAFFEYPSKYRGIKKYNETNHYLIFVELPLGGHIIYFIDTESYLVTRRLVSWEGKPEQELWENIIENYIKYDGFLFPDGYVFEGREGKEKGYYKNVKINIDTADKLFQIPEELLD